VGEEVIGLTLVAVGTSLPELATAVVAAWRRHSEVAIGNVIGANIYNLLAIMGLVSAVTPIEVPPQILRFDLWLMLGVTLALLGTIAVRRGLDRRVAAAFLGAYAAYVAAQYYGVETLLGGLGGHP
jgi:cation:H+ antiporter